MQYCTKPLALAIKYDLDLEIFTSNVEPKHGAPKLPSVFAFDASGSLSVGAVFDEDDA